MAKRLGDLLIEENLITEEQLNEAIENQQKSGEPLGRILVRMGLITEEALYYFLAIQFGVDFVELSNRTIPDDVIKIIKKEIAEEFNIIPIESTDNKIVFATSEPDEHLILKLKEKTLLPHEKEIKFVVATETDIKNALSMYYGVTEKFEMDDSLKEILKESQVQTEEMEEEAVEGSYTENDAPVIKITNALIGDAVRLRASDIHLNPFPKNMVVRYRIDGVLQTQKSPPRQYRNAIVSRIKVMARLDIMEKRKAQDGRIKIKVQNKIIDLRVSVLPSIYGENVVMRILDQEGLMLDLSKLGFEPKELEIYKDAIQSPYGLILHTGPTGSGKTTTLYSALSTINDVSKNIMTLEDPVEYQLPGIIQIQMNHEINFDFAMALRSVLRQDPNIMMVGEIRDKETADIAIKAALTGHLLFSTLHTNDAPGALTRLIDMGVEPFLVASSTVGILAQRLVRKICSSCKEKYAISEQIIKELNVDTKIAKPILYRGKGCKTCKETGYKGRIGIYELLIMNENIRNMVLERKSADVIRKAAQENGMKTLREDGLRKAFDGITSIEEVIRVTTTG